MNIEQRKNIMAKKIRVIQYGLGPIGAATARLVHERSGLELVGGVDIDPSKEGKDVGAIIGFDEPLGFTAAKSIGYLRDHVEADIVLHTTSSKFSKFTPELLELLDCGYNIVSTSEELSFPWSGDSEEANVIDAAARKAGKTVLGTGVNPGFIMDSLPLNLTAICQQVDHIEVQRTINASTRRGPFQAKIGSGLSVDTFNEKMAAGTIGHMGLLESVGMVMDTLGRKMVDYESSVEPIITDCPVETAHFSVQAGQVIGLKQTASAVTETGEFMKLAFIASLDAKDEGDIITITGKPSLKVKLSGTNGDLATVAIAVNAVPRVMEAGPGLVTMRGLPIVTCWL
jgi:2,4-diaminopentanoate dehydrogenase